MDEDREDRSAPGELTADSEPADDPSAASDDRPAAREPGSRLPIDQQALNVIGLAQAREQLREARSRRERGAEPAPIDEPTSVDEDELQASVDRHPAARARRRMPRPVDDVVRGVIVAESLRLGAVVVGISLVVRKLERVDAGLGEQPRHWTLLSFEAAADAADRLAETLAHTLEPVGGWYADFHSDTHVTVVFSGRVFRYRRGDMGERAKVEEYARSVGVPAAQLDWSE